MVFFKFQALLLARLSVRAKTFCTIIVLTIASITILLILPYQDYAWTKLEPDKINWNTIFCLAVSITKIITKNVSNPLIILIRLPARGRDMTREKKKMLDEVRTISCPFIKHAFKSFIFSSMRCLLGMRPCPSSSPIYLFNFSRLWSKRKDCLILFMAQLSW